MDIPPMTTTPATLQWTLTRVAAVILSQRLLPVGHEWLCIPPTAFGYAVFGTLEVRFEVEHMKVGRYVPAPGNPHAEFVWQQMRYQELVDVLNAGDTLQVAHKE